MKVLLAAAALIAGSTLLFANAARASRSVNENYFANDKERSSYLTIDSVEVREIATTREVRERFAAAVLQPGPVVDSLVDSLASSRPGSLADSQDEGLFPGARIYTANTTSAAEDLIGVIANPQNIEGWIRIGEKAWQVISANKPVANVGTQKISVLPKAETDWSAMENWKTPMTKSYVIEAKNLYGMTVISHAYTVAYNYGGSFKGKGAYIANATVIPTAVDVVWGYTLNSRVEVGDIVNTGTKKNPVPGVSLTLIYSIDTVLKHSEGRDTFFIRGDGQTTRM